MSRPPKGVAARRGTIPWMAPLPPLASPASKPTIAMDPTDAALISAAQRIANAKAVALLANDQGTSSMPQPATVQDTIALSKEARESAAAIAQQAQEVAEAERQRRLEAEQRAASAYEAGQQEAHDRWSQILEIIKSKDETVLQLLKQNQESQLQAERTKAEQLVQSMKDAAERTIEALKQQNEALRAEHERLQKQVQELSQRPTLEALAFQVMSNPSDPRFAIFRQIYAPVSQGESFEEWWRKEVAKRKLNEIDEEERRKEEKHRATLGILRPLAETAQQLPRVVPNVLGAPRGVGRNGVADDFGMTEQEGEDE